MVVIIIPASLILVFDVCKILQEISGPKNKNVFPFIMQSLIVKIMLVLDEEYFYFKEMYSGLLLNNKVIILRL